MAHICDSTSFETLHYASCNSEGSFIPLVSNCNIGLMDNGTNFQYIHVLKFKLIFVVSINCASSAKLDIIFGIDNSISDQESFELFKELIKYLILHDVAKDTRIGFTLYDKSATIPSSHSILVIKFNLNHMKI